MDGRATMTNLHIHRPPSGLARTVEHCPVCKARRRHIRRYYEWYDVLTVCCGCGSRWSGVEMLPQTKRERKDSATAARGDWPLGQSVREAVTGTLG